MSHVSTSANWPKEAFEQGNLLNTVEHTNYGKGSRPYAIDGDKVEIRGFLVPETRLMIAWTRCGPGHIGNEPSGNRQKLVAERPLNKEETARVMNAVASGRFAFLPTGPQDQFYLELAPVEYNPIYRKMMASYAWSGMWEVA